MNNEQNNSVYQSALNKIKCAQKFKPNNCVITIPTGVTGPTGPAGATAMHRKWHFMTKKEIHKDFI